MPPQAAEPCGAAAAAAAGATGHHAAAPGGAAGTSSSSSSSRVPRSKVVRVKIISMGAMGVGKSCLIKRYCEEKFISRYIPTIGIDYGVKPVSLGGYELRANLWDLGGAPDYLQVRNEFYKDSQAALLAYDATSRPSFDVLPAWLEEAAAHGAPGSMAVFVAATKTDLPGRRVSADEGRAWATTRGYPYFETSAATGRGVVPLFASLFNATLAQLPNLDHGLTSCAAQVAAAACLEEGLQL